MHHNTTIIGISAVSGGGKTRLVNELASQIRGVATVSFDDFDDSTKPPDDLRLWLTQGGDYNAWQTPELTRELQSLVSSNKSSGRRGGGYVVFDAPLGRAHEETGRFIDHMVFVDTPLDVAMARRQLRDGFDQWGDQHLRHYLEWSRELFTHHVEQISTSADLIVDGLLPVETLATTVIGEFDLIT